MAAWEDQSTKHLHFWLCMSGGLLSLSVVDQVPGLIQCFQYVAIVFPFCELGYLPGVRVLGTDWWLLGTVLSALVAQWTDLGRFHNYECPGTTAMRSSSLK